jgi:predicted RNA-binding Zn ribbon-like protein
MSDLQYVEVLVNSTAKEVLSGAPLRKLRRQRKLNPNIKEWKICESCGLSFYRVEGSTRKLCDRTDCLNRRAAQVQHVRRSR